MTTALDTLNPFRYRGYVYDEETGLYCLRSRYYNPEWGRFINADTVLGQAGALLSHNLFIYCENDPVRMKDSDGHRFEDSAGGSAFAFGGGLGGYSGGGGLGILTLNLPPPMGGSQGIATVGILALGFGIRHQAEEFISGLMDVFSKPKPVNLPSPKKITIEIDHIMSGYGSGGNRGGPYKSNFPGWVTSANITKVVIEAYKVAKK